MRHRLAASYQIRSDSRTLRCPAVSHVRYATRRTGTSAFTPEPPTFTPEPPTFKLEPPTFTPELPTFTPEAPTFTPEPPTFTLEPPTFTAEPPTFTPEPPTFTLEPPTFTAEDPTFTPEPPTFTAEPPTFTTEPPTFTLEYPAVTAEPPTFTPEPPTFTVEPPPNSCSANGVATVVANDDSLSMSELRLATIDSPCEYEHNTPESLDGLLPPSVVLAAAPAVSLDEASSLSNVRRARGDECPKSKSDKKLRGGAWGAGPTRVNPRGDISELCLATSTVRRSRGKECPKSTPDKLRGDVWGACDMPELCLGTSTVRSSRGEECPKSKLDKLRGCSWGAGDMPEVCLAASTVRCLSREECCEKDSEAVLGVWLPAPLPTSRAPPGRGALWPLAWRQIWAGLMLDLAA